ncbi:MAG: DUF3667 domain-containing protein [Winogradskyella sp.]
MKTSQTHCPNCELSHQKDFEFCPYCGQKTNEELTLGILFYNTISNYFSFDARFFKSFLPLLLKPGFLAKAFIKGKRLLYLHPAQMYLFVAVIFFFVFSFIARDGREEIDKNMDSVLSNRTSHILTKKDSLVQDSITIKDYLKPITDNRVVLGIDDKDLKRIDSISKIKPSDFEAPLSFNKEKIDALIAKGASNKTLYKAIGLTNDAGYIKRKVYTQGLRLYKTMGLGQVYQAFIDSIPLAMFFLLPIFAFLLKLFFFNKGRYAHHLVFSFYYFSFLFVVFSFVFGINRFWDIPNGLDWLIIVSTFFYLYIAIIKFYRQHWLLSFIKSGVVSFLFLMIVMPFSSLILAFIAFLFY